MENNTNTDSFESFLEADEDATGWMTTFADLMTLLLVFFVLLYSISSFNLQKFTIAFKSININLGNMNQPTGIMPLEDIPGLLNTKLTIEELTGLRKRIDSIYEELEQFIEGKNLGENIDLQYVEGKIIIMIQGHVLFPSGSAELNKNAIPVLDEIADLVSGYPEYTVNIKGHTDDVPISTSQFPSNWELSAIRATSVLKHMIHSGISAERLTATGYGEVLPLVPNTTKENRAINRRVEFVLEKKTK